jgi:alpha-beta hydrolase superfamily lysophospholipase
VDKYIADPLCGFVATVSLFRDMMGGIKFIGDQKNIDRMNKDKPVYFMSGAADPVGDNGKGVEKAYKAFCKAGLKDVFLRLYPEGRHEMLNEINKEQVCQDILNWLNEKLA